jgi:hypothetical protein
MLQDVALGQEGDSYNSVPLSVLQKQQEKYSSIITSRATPAVIG